MPFVDAIPSDYDGMMGVPITFLDKYNPDQFEIVGSSWTTTPPTKTYGTDSEAFVDGYTHEVEHRGSACYVRAESFGSGRTSTSAIP